MTRRVPRRRAPARAALVLVLATLPSLEACGRSSAELPPPDAPQTVRVAEIAREALAPPIHGTGLLGPKEEITLGFKVGGVIARIAVDEGAAVRKGDVLASLELREIDAAVARARAAAEKAERDLARAQRLFADSVATREQVQDAETAADVARAARDAAEFDRRYAVITAPANGIVLRRFSEPGELVAPADAVLRIGSRARGSVVRVGLADRDAARVRPGDPATVRFDVGSGPVDGRVAEIAAAADPATGTFRVEIAVPGVERLASGLVADVVIRPAGDGPLPVIPVDAMLEADGDSAVVFVLDEAGSRAVRHGIRIAFLAGDRVAVASGLDDARRVITAGASRVDDGDRVEVLP